MTPLELKVLAEELKKKWPEEPPKFSREWFSYRGDQSYYRMKRDELKVTQNAKKDIVTEAESIFNGKEV